MKIKSIIDRISPFRIKIQNGVERKMARADDIARYIINYYDVDNLKLQKLLYYCQGVYMTLHKGKPLFPERIEAWTYGPVVPSVYYKYKDEELISPDDDIRTEEDKTKGFGLSSDELEAISMTLEFYGQNTGVELINKTHKEAPWKDNYNPENIHNEIPKDQIYSFFKNTLQFSE